MHCEATSILYYRTGELSFSVPTQLQRLSKISYKYISQHLPLRETAMRIIEENIEELEVSLKFLL